MLRSGVGRRTSTNRNSGGPGLVAGLKPVAWWKFGVGLTDDGGGLCSLWADQSGNGRNLTAATTARPTIQADKSLLFDGVANVMKTAAFTVAAPFTIYVLMRQVSWTSGRILIDGDGATIQGRISQSGVSPALVANGGTALASNSNLAVGTYGVLAFVVNGASSSFQVNNTSATAGNAGSNSLAAFTMGAAGNSTNFSNIQVKEGVIFGAGHDANTIFRVIRHLSQVGAVPV